MTVRTAKVEKAVENVIRGLDALIGAVIAETRSPMDMGLRAQSLAIKAELKEAIINLLMLIDMED